MLLAILLVFTLGWSPRFLSKIIKWLTSRNTNTQVKNHETLLTRKIDLIALLLAYPFRCNSATRHNQPILYLPVFIIVICEPIVGFRNRMRCGMSLLLLSVFQSNITMLLSAIYGGSVSCAVKLGEDLFADFHSARAQEDDCALCSLLRVNFLTMKLLFHTFFIPPV